MPSESDDARYGTPGGRSLSAVDVAIAAVACAGLWLLWKPIGSCSSCPSNPKAQIEATAIDDARLEDTRFDDTRFDDTVRTDA